MPKGDTPGLCKLDNGKLTRRLATVLGISPTGCAYRGTVVCHQCPLAIYVARRCDYQCHECMERARCPCGQPGMDQIVDRLLGKIASYVINSSVMINHEVGNNGHRDYQGSKSHRGDHR